MYECESTDCMCHRMQINAGQFLKEAINDKSMTVMEYEYYLTLEGVAKTNPF